MPRSSSASTRRAAQAATVKALQAFGNAEYDLATETVWCGGSRIHEPLRVGAERDRDASFHPRGEDTRVAFILYARPDDIPPEDRVPDRDNIVRIHGVHSGIIRLHYDLYRELMHGPGPLSRAQREMIAVTVSGINGCHY